MADDEAGQPPLPRGSYNIDFDALDDSFNPFGSKSGSKLRNSPPVDEQVVRGVAIVHDDVPVKGGTGNGAGDADTPVKVCDGSEVDAKSVKTTAAVGSEVDSVADSPASHVGSGGQEAVPSDSSPPMKTESKPVKKKGTKVVKKPKSRPVSKNLEGQGGPDIEILVAGQPPPPTQPADEAVSQPPPLSTSSQDVRARADAASAPPATAAPPEENNTPEKSKPEKAEKSDAEKPAPPQESTADKSTPELSTPVKSPRPTEGSDSAETTPRREKSGTKVKKSKHKSHRRSGSHSEGTDTADGVRRESEGRDSGSEHASREREPRRSPRSSASAVSGESHEPTVAAGEQATPSKSKHPAARVLEQQVQGEAAAAHHADASLGKGESEMADTHTNQSVVKLVQDSKKSDKVLKYSQSDWNKMKQELELGFQAQLLAKEREWGIKLADRDTRIATLEDNNKKLKQTNEDMRVVVAEFEKTISQLQSEKEKTSNASQQSLQDVIKERDQALEDLQSVETAFSDLHRRYEKTKAVIEGFKQNEEVLKKCVADLQSKLKKTEQKVQTLKAQAEEKLEKATEEIDKAHKASASEIARLEAALRKAELQVQSQEALLEQKVKENTELAAICDELIAKVQ